MKIPSNVSLKRANIDNATLERGQATLPHLRITVRPLGFSHSLSKLLGDYHWSTLRTDKPTFCAKPILPLNRRLRLNTQEDRQECLSYFPFNW